MDKQKKVKLERNLCDIYFESLWDLIYLLLLIVRGQSTNVEYSQNVIAAFLPCHATHSHICEGRCYCPFK